MSKAAPDDITAAAHWTAHLAAGQRRRSEVEVAQLQQLGNGLTTATPRWIGSSGRRGKIAAPSGIGTAANGRCQPCARRRRRHDCPPSVWARSLFGKPRCRAARDRRGRGIDDAEASRPTDRHLRHERREDGVAGRGVHGAVAGTRAGLQCRVRPRRGEAQGKRRPALKPHGRDDIRRLARHSGSASEKRTRASDRAALLVRPSLQPQRRPLHAPIHVHGQRSRCRRYPCRVRCRWGVLGRHRAAAAVPSRNGQRPCSGVRPGHRYVEADCAAAADAAEKAEGK